jgi:hypothetical protein
MSIVTVIIIIFIIWTYYIYLAHPLYKSYEYYELKNRYKTGDIILFHALDNMNPIFIGTYYGHIGIVYVDPDDQNAKPQIFEAFSSANMPFYPKECANGVVLADLEHRLSSYRGYCLYKELMFPVAHELQRGFREFIDYAINNMKYNEAVISNGINKMLWNETLHLGTNCGELVYMSLIKLGLVPFEKLEENRKHHLVHTANIKQVEGNQYQEPVYILSNYFKI